MQFERNQNTYAGAQQQVDAGLRKHMSSVYNRMTAGVLITALVAWLVGSSQALMTLFLGGPQMYVVMFAPLALIWFGFNPMKMSSQKMMMVFGLLSVLYGISFSTIAYAFAGAEIARAFFITTAMFAGLSIFGYTTKKDLSALGTFCFMGVLGLIAFSIVGMFFQFPAGVSMFIDIGAILIFAGITAWQTQETKQMYNRANGDEINSRMAWVAALNLYISFIAMFSRILSLMSDN